MDVRRALLVLFCLGMALGVGLGFLVGWGIWPVEYYDTDPVDLKEQHKNEYIVLVAASYALNGDLDQAEARLAKLEERDVAQVVADLAQEYLQRAEDMIVTRSLVNLANALGSASQIMLAYVATATPTFTSTPTQTPTDTPLPTATETPTPIPTDTPTATATPLPPTPTYTPRPPTPTSPPASPTPLPPSATPPSLPVTPPSTIGPPTATNSPTATQPPVASCPNRPGVVIFDIGEQPRDWGWVQENFGDVATQQATDCPGGSVYAVNTLRESTSTALAVIVVDRYGYRQPNVPVAFFGFGAGSCPGSVVDTAGACRPNACVTHTNQDGEANIPMYWTGSGYDPAQGPGYHAVWVLDATASDCTTGLGMVVNTFHNHLNITFREM